MKNMKRDISKLVNRFIEESFVDITEMNTDEVMETSVKKNKKFGDGRDEIDVAKPKGKITGADFRKLQSMKKDKKRSPAGFEPGELVAEEGETEEGNAFAKAVIDAKKAKKKTFRFDNETYDVKESVNKKIERILERRRGRLSENTKKNKVVFTESQLIDFIERIVEAEAKEDKTTIKSLKSSKSVNDDAIAATVKKMKEYMENMGMEYKETTENFPSGNKVMARQGKEGETKDDIKKAYKASEKVEEYVENFTAAGLENLDYDNIKPNEDWATDNIEGSSRTGNSPKYANAIETNVNKKINEKRKKNLLAVLKRQAYNKAPQPVHSDEAGESVPSSIAKSRNSEVNKITAENEVIDKKVINDMEKISKLINYGKKTQ